MTAPAAPSAGPRPARIPCLDGLRAISVILVILAHLPRIPSAPAFLVQLVPEGPTGVNIFFVISGYLITGLLLRERREHGSVDLLAFYKRRARRILPPAYAYLLVLAIVAFAGYRLVPWGEIGWSFLYLRNFLPAGSPGTDLTTHLWSLAVEEHFYLLWPVAVAFASPRSARRIAAWVIVGAFASRFLVLGLVPDPSLGIAWWTPCRADFLMFGCLAALLEAEGDPVLARITGRSAAACLALLLLSRLFDMHWFRDAARPIITDRLFHLVPFWERVPAATLEGFCTAVLVLWCVRNPAGAVGRVLNARPVAWLGVVSYSLYLWHALLITGPGVAMVDLPWPAAALGAVVLAAASHHLIERPFLAIRVATRHGTAG